MKTSFDTYLGYEELTRTLRALAEEHPGLCRLGSIGKSYEGREIWLAEITNPETGPPSEKPAFWVDGNAHAGEVTGSMAALYLIETLLEGYGADERITRLLDRQSFYVLPRLSPDGAERYLSTPHTLRASLRPWPESEEEPGLHPEDLDGDGHIVQMRVEDDNGEWRVSEKDGRLMVLRAPDEAETGGKHYRLYQEGTFKGYDGFKARRPDRFWVVAYRELDECGFPPYGEGRRLDNTLRRVEQDGGVVRLLPDKRAQSPLQPGCHRDLESRAG